MWVKRFQTNFLPHKLPSANIIKDPKLHDSHPGDVPISKVCWFSFLLPNESKLNEKKTDTEN